MKVINDVTFRVQRADHPRKCLVVHFNRLKPYIGREVQENPEQTLSPSYQDPLEEDLIPLAITQSTDQHAQARITVSDQSSITTEESSDQHAQARITVSDQPSITTEESSDQHAQARITVSDQPSITTEENNTIKYKPRSTSPKTLIKIS